MLDNHDKVNLGKSWKKLESDLIIRNKLNFKSDLIFRKRESIVYFTRKYYLFHFSMVKYKKLIYFLIFE